ADSRLSIVRPCSALSHPAPPRRGPTEKLAALTARRIEADIISRGWPIGEVVGSEQDLQERYGVSRSALREAVRLVEHHQVARMRRGPNGGLVVSAPDAGPATRALVIYLEYIGLSIENLMRARLLLEPLAVELTIRNLREEGIDRMRALLDAEAAHRDEETVSLDALHVLLGELSGNPALHLFIDVTTRLTARYGHSLRRIPREKSARTREISRARHAAVVDAILGGQPGSATAEMTAHLDEVTAWFVENDARGARRPGHRPTADGSTAEPAAKLAEVVAARIRDEVVRRRWPVGQVLGSENDLVARYGTSRAVLREAVRLLELDSVARMRRGPGGGLVVAEPLPDASIEAMALYLDYREVTAEDLRVVRDAIELGTIDEVILRRDDPEVAARLQEAIARGHEPTDAGAAGSDRFHIELAHLSGNPVLELFLRILSELWLRHTTGVRKREPGPDAVDGVKHIHGRILDALLEGDTGVARHRMRRHLAALTAWYHE
uniref:FadR/GntR family transcriptional regulator n=1 Tax=Pseudonocardia pini TaxID=2758030 RepID=UPI001C68CE66